MIVLDTNVLSEPLKKAPDTRVIDWLRRHARDDLVITAISVGELHTGVRFLPVGKRRTDLQLAIDRAIDLYEDRVLSYDLKAARLYGHVRELSRSQGHAITVEDAMIASLCWRENATLATRNIKDFTQLGITLTNPWAYESH